MNEFERNAYIDLKGRIEKLQSELNALSSEINEKSVVSFTQTLTSGEEIGTLTIDDVDTKLYAPVDKHLEWVKVAEAEGDQTYSAQLTILSTAFNALSDEEQKHTRIIRGDTHNFIHVSRYTFVFFAPSASSFTIHYVRTDDYTHKHISFALSDGAFGYSDETEETNTLKLSLQVLRLVDNE